MKSISLFTLICLGLSFQPVTSISDRTRRLGTKQHVLQEITMLNTPATIAAMDAINAASIYAETTAGQAQVDALLKQHGSTDAFIKAIEQLEAEQISKSNAATAWFTQLKKSQSEQESIANNEDADKKKIADKMDAAALSANLETAWEILDTGMATTTTDKSYGAFTKSGLAVAVVPKGYTLKVVITAAESKLAELVETKINDAIKKKGALKFKLEVEKKIVAKLGLVTPQVGVDADVNSQVTPGAPTKVLYARGRRPGAARDGMFSASMGVCLQRTADSVNNMAIATWHNYVPANANVEYLSLWGQWNVRVGTMSAAGVHAGPADYDFVDFAGAYRCSCGNVRDPRVAAGALAPARWSGRFFFHAQVEIRKTFMANQDVGMAYTGGISGFRRCLPVVTGELFTVVNTDMGMVTMLVTQRQSVSGDSGSALLMDGHVVGILHGSLDGMDWSVWTPIWNVNIPAGYRIC